MLPYYRFTVYHIGPITLQVWGTFVALGLAIALYLGYKESRRRGLSEDAFLSFGLWAIVSAMIAARLFYVALFWSSFSNAPLQILKVWNGGMVAYGGVIGALVALFLYCRYHKLDTLAYLDVVALAFPAGYAVGRIGCHLIRDHMGKLTHVPWGFVVAPGVVRHDTAVYSILVGIALFLIFWPQRKKTIAKGAITLWTALLYAITRFVIDNFRATDIPGSDPRFAGFTISQYISAVVVLICGFLLIRMYQPWKLHKKV